MDATSYASIEDLESRFKPLDPFEKNKAAALLSDAAVIIRAEMASAGVLIDPNDADQASALRYVNCSLVKRALSAGIDAAVTQASITTGPFSKQLTFANPTAEMFLTKQDRRLLGITQNEGGFSFIRPMICRGDEDA